VRKEIGIRTVFNILGPLTNPAGAEHMLLGVPNEELGKKIAAALHRLGTKHALVVCGKEGLDEISISGKSIVWEVTKDKVSPPREVSPESFGKKKAKMAEIEGGTPQENAATLMCVLDGEKGVPRDIVVINAAAALIAGDITTDMKQAVKFAEETIDSGKAKDIMEKLVVLSRQIGERDKLNP
jgi:anthranilate phosphoribosyltransferase